jgi:hypothetical protein
VLPGLTHSDYKSGICPSRLLAPECPHWIDRRGATCGDESGHSRANPQHDRCPKVLEIDRLPNVLCKLECANACPIKPNIWRRGLPSTAGQCNGDARLTQTLPAATYDADLLLGAVCCCAVDSALKSCCAWRMCSRIAARASSGLRARIAR